MFSSIPLPYAGHATQSLCVRRISFTLARSSSCVDLPLSSYLISFRRFSGAALWVIMDGFGPWRSQAMSTCDRVLRLHFHINHASILHCFRDIESYFLKVANFFARVFDDPVWDGPIEFFHQYLFASENQCHYSTMGVLCMTKLLPFLIGHRLVWDRRTVWQADGLWAVS